MKIFYKSIGFVIGKNVTIQFWDSNLNKLPLQTFNELEEGLYYLDFDFEDCESYIAIAYEDGVKTIAKSFRVNKQFGVVYFLD